LQAPFSQEGPRNSADDPFWSQPRINSNCITISCAFALRHSPFIRFLPRSISFRPWRSLKPENSSADMRNVVITGGSRGIGLGITRRVIAAGFRAIAIARKESNELASTIEETERANPEQLRFVRYDLSEIEGIGDLVKRLRKDFGPIYGLVNNAGISAEGTLTLMNNSQIEQLVRLNTLSPMVMTKYVVRSMMADGGGRIVNIASIVASTGYSGLSVYSATKASLIGFTRSLAREVGRMGVNVNAVAPGFVDTEMTRSLTAEHREQIVRRSALRRLVDTDDVANAVEFLLSDKAKNITGTVLTVDAGNTA
jgi:3-oxoacyl-[acyl-carrier protein] reductase